MKKIFALVLLIIYTVTTQAQVKTKVEKIKPQSPMKTKEPAPGESKAPAAGNTPVTNTTYYLTGARISIVTGNDNKEQPSRASIALNRTSGGEWPSDDKTTPCGLYNYNFTTRILNEYKINSVTDLTLVSSFQFPYTFPGGVGEGWRYINLKMEEIQTYGLTLYVNYDPNFVLDAWKIEKVTLTLEFKDLNGNAHPSLGTVVIPFLNSSTLLNDKNRTLKLETDKFLMPKN